MDISHYLRWYAVDSDDDRFQEEKAMKKVLFFPNGNTAVLDQEQIPELQKSWASLFAEFLESKGEDPTEFELNFPTYRTARFFRTDDGWNWRFDP